MGIEHEGPQVQPKDALTATFESLYSPDALWAATRFIGSITRVFSTAIQGTSFVASVVAGEGVKLGVEPVLTTGGAV